MGAFVSWIAVEELEALDPHQLALLKESVARHISESPEIKQALHDKFRPTVDRMKANAKAKPAATPRPAKKKKV